MWFWMFQRACHKYCFAFTLSTYGGLRLTLIPSRLNLKSKLSLKSNGAFKDIELTEHNLRYGRLFRKAIKEMKKYRS